MIDDGVVSNRHLRIYSVSYEGNVLIYAEDLSRNGTYWNRALMGKGNGGFLLSDGDALRISPRITFEFETCVKDDAAQLFDWVREEEFKVQPGFQHNIVKTNGIRNFRPSIL